jgi:hypothetical protein
MTARKAKARTKAKANTDPSTALRMKDVGEGSRMRSGSGWQVVRLDAGYIDFLWRSLTILPLRELLRSCCETGCGE